MTTVSFRVKVKVGLRIGPIFLTSSTDVQNIN
jgi:hypothetical protein